MGESKHTPGPWYFDGFRVRSRVDRLPVDSNREPLELEANLSLEAAAPDLFAAADLAIATVERLNRHNSADGTLDVLRAAIAKAKGE